MSARRLARRFVCVLAASVLVLISTTVALIARPEWVLTSTVVAHAIRSFAGAFQPSWSRLGFQIRSTTLLRKQIAFSAGDLCFAKSGSATGGCLAELDLRFSIQLSTAGVRISEISRINVQGDRLVVDLTRPARAGAHGATKLEMPNALRGTVLGDVDVDLPRVRVIERGASTRVSARLSYGAARAEPLAVALEASRRTLGRNKSAPLRLRLHGTSDLRSGRIAARLDGRDMRSEIAVRGRRLRGGFLALQIRASGRAGQAVFDGRASGTANPSAGPPDSEMRGVLNVRLSSGPVQALRLNPFKLTSLAGASAWSPKELRLTSRFQATLAQMSAGTMFRAPPGVAGEAVLNARLTPTKKEKDRFEAVAAARLDPHQDWYAFTGAVRVGASGRLGAIKRARIHHDIDVSLEIPRFERLVAELASTPYAVPAPLAALRGPLRLKMRCEGSPSIERQMVAYQWNTDLAAERQKLRMRGDGLLTVAKPLSPGRSIENEATILLEEVALQLPKLEPARLPSVKLDARIATEKAGARPGRKAPTLALRSDIRVRTGKEALFYSNLAKTPIPVSLDVKVTQPQGALAGTIRTSSFQAEVFRRNAVVDHMRLVRRPDSKSGEIDGLILYDAHEAQVRIRLLGTTEKPHVVLESDPPMNESEILGLLLYGKSPNELDPDQQSTVANAQTGMADRAFGLASLYVFASTPIEYVGFDPASRTYTMKFRIPGGASLELGSTLEASRTVQVRKRIASHFAIQAQGRNTPEGSSVGTFLEWFNRY